MIYGVIDVGSNTIRLCVYDCVGADFKLLLSRKETAGLAGYVEKGALSARGIDRCVETLKSYQESIRPFDPDGLFVFATASLRNVRNTDEAVRRIFEETGIQVDVLPGWEEALLDFKGATRTAGLESGLLADIGGGSIELVSFSHGTIEHAESIDVGSLSLHTRYVEDLLPTQKERRAIKEAVAERIDSLRAFRGRSFTDLCGVGGTLRGACRLYNARAGLPPENLALPAGAVKELLRPFKNPEKEDLDLLLQLAPDRVHTLVPGMLALQVILRTFGVERICVSLCGVREGYLCDRVLSPAHSARSV